MAGGMHGGGHAWQGTCMAGACMVGCVCGRGSCMAGACMAGAHAWQGGIHGRGHACQGACMAGGVHGRGHAWQGVAIAVGGMHPTGMHSCFSHALNRKFCLNIEKNSHRQPIIKLYRDQSEVSALPAGYDYAVFIFLKSNSRIKQKY